MFRKYLTSNLFSSLILTQFNNSLRPKHTGGALPFSSKNSLFQRCFTTRSYSTFPLTLEAVVPELEELHKIEAELSQSAAAPHLLLRQLEGVHDRIEEKIYADELQRGIAFLENYKFQEAKHSFNIIISQLEKKLKSSGIEKDFVKSILTEAYAQKGKALLGGREGIMSEGEAYKCLQKALKLQPTHELALEKMELIKFERGETSEDEHGNIKFK